MVIIVSCSKHSRTLPYTKVDFYEDIYLPKQNLSPDFLDNFKNSFSKKAISLVRNNNDSTVCFDDYPGDYEYRTRDRFIQNVMSKNQVNINAYDEFKKIGIDCTNIVFREGAQNRPYDKNELAYRFFTARIIITATVIDSIIVKVNTREVDYAKANVSDYYKHYILELNEVIKGEHLFDEFPKRIEVKSQLGLDHLVKEEGDSNYTKKMMYLSKTINFEPSEQIIFKISNRASKQTIEEFLNNGSTFVYSGNVFSQQILKMIEEKEYSCSIHDIIRLYKKLEEINDTPNFFKRSY